MAPSSAAQIEIRMGEVQRQLQTLTARYEEQLFELRRLQDRLDRFQGDVEARLAALEASGPPPAAGAPFEAPDTPALGGMAGSNPDEPVFSGTRQPDPLARSPFERFGDDAGQSPGETADPARDPAPSRAATGSVADLFRAPTGTGQGTPPPAPGGLGETPPPSAVSGNPQAAYDRAFTLLADADYAAAERGFNDFLSAHGDHEFADNARYWLAETYYVRGQMERAAVGFAEAFQTAPTGSKAPDNLLKLGMALGQLGRVEDACVTLGELTSGFPDAPVTILRRAEQERSRLDCGDA